MWHRFTQFHTADFSADFDVHLKYKLTIERVTLEGSHGSRIINSFKGTWVASSYILVFLFIMSLFWINLEMISVLLAEYKGSSGP